jgi:CRISPR-associated endonuclease/helicase Cas3
VGKLQCSYFDKYYVSNQNKLDYPDSKRGSSMVEELGYNQLDMDAYNMAVHSEKKPVMFQAFRTAAENFHLIDEGTTGVLVQYKNEELLTKLEIAMNEKNYSEVKNLLQKLQRYCINIYIDEKLRPFIVEKKEYNVYYLLEKYYNKKTGIDTKYFVDLIL